jgi:hypothetical protein
MKHDKIKDNILCHIPRHIPTIQLVITVIGLISTILAFYITYRLVPIQKSIEALAEENIEIKEEQKIFVTNKEFQLILTRLDKISSRLDNIIFVKLKE